MCHSTKQHPQMEQNNQIATNPKREVVQSFLITTARYRFSVYEKRILSKLITCMQPMLEGKKLIGKVERSLFGDVRFELPMSFFTDDRNYKNYQEALSSLVDKKIEFEDSNVFLKIPLIQYVKIVKHSGIVTLQICNELVELFLNFSKGYSKYILEVSMELKSTASARLYELISNQPHPLTYSIEKLKDILDPSHTYPKTCNFIQRIIEPAKKELDKVANWSFTYEPIKKGRKYIALQLTPVNFPQREPQDVQRADALRQVNLSWYIEKDIRDFLTKACGFSAREIKNNLPTIQKFIAIFAKDSLNRVMEIWSRSQDKRNPKAYLIGVLKLEIEQ